MAVINGTSDSDALNGTDAADFLNGFGGNDILRGSPGADAMNGGDGDDRVNYGLSSAIRIFLDNTQDATGGDAAGDLFLSIEEAAGSAFNDTIHGGNGTDNKLTGHAGDDTLKGLGGDDTLDGGPGADTLDGGPGTDRATYIYATSAVRVFLASGGAGGEAQGDRYTSIEDVTLSDFNDIAVGDDADNKILGGDGADLVFGGPSTGPTGNDTLWGNDGDDALWGLDGDDKLFGRERRDTLTGGTGNDDLLGGTGDDILFGGDFTAMGTFASGSGQDDLRGEEGDDTIWGFDGDDFIDLGAGGGQPASFQYADGGEGNDTILGGAGANAYLIGGAGDDTIGGHVGAIDYIWGDDPSNPAVNGVDTFVFRVGSSFDQIFDFRSGDNLELHSAFGVSSLADFVARVTLSSGGANTGYTIFTSDNGLDQLVVHGRSASSWTAVNLEFFT